MDGKGTLKKIAAEILCKILYNLFVFMKKAAREQLLKNQTI